MLAVARLARTVAVEASAKDKKDKRAVGARRTAGAAAASATTATTRRCGGRRRFPRSARRLSVMGVGDSAGRAGGGRRPTAANRTLNVDPPRRARPPASARRGRRPAAGAPHDGLDPRRQAGRLPHASRSRRKPAAPATAAGRGGVAVAPRMGSALRELVRRLGRGAVRRARRPVAGLPAAAPGAARSGAQLPLQLPRAARGRSEEQGGDHGDARLRRPAVLPARVLRLEDRAAVRLPRLRSRQRIARRRAARRSTATKMRRTGKDTLAVGRRASSASSRTACSRAARGRRWRTTRPTTTRCRSIASALRPGVIYADPYGHVMVVVKWVDQTADKGGLLLAVDGQPDTSIGRKRFWEGTFLFNNEAKSAGPGFKAFRPDRARRRREAGAAGEQGDRRQGRPGARAVLGRAEEGVVGRLLRAHGQAHQPQGAGRGEGLPRDAGRAGRAADGAHRLGRQRREVHEGEGGGAR